jgi:hypothetical protein
MEYIKTPYFLIFLFAMGCFFVANINRSDYNDTRNGVVSLQR